jgi:DNA polymerase IV
MLDSRKIIHCDCDCYYASIEMRDNPELAGLPLAVGGLPQRRGVVATCNYEARRFGIHSAMAAATARRLCPDLIIIRPDMEKYRLASRQMHKIFLDYTDIIEPLSLDEAFLDVTDSEKCQGSASLMAKEIRERIAMEIGITVSAGIAPNKFVAKVASDWNKPNGQFTVLPEQVDEFVRDLPVKKLYGVGTVTANKFNRMGLFTCGDLRALGLEQIQEKFGSFGERLHQLCRGIDHRPVKISRIRKSLSVENTFVEDLQTLDNCMQALPDLLEDFQCRFNRLEGRYCIVKQFIKIKFHDFVSTTVEMLSENTNSENFATLLATGFARGNRPVRLLGLGVRLNPAIVDDSSKEDKAVENYERRVTHTINDPQLVLSLE